MKVKIGPYKSWFGPYQCADLLKYLGVSEDNCDKVAEWLPAGPFNWVDKTFKKRKVNIRIDRYDTWDMDHTLALIIHPMLIQLKATKHGHPWVDDEDVPEEIQSFNSPKKKNEWDWDDNCEKRWEYVIDEMIHSFYCSIDDTWEEKYYKGDIINPIIDHETLDKERKRIANGFRLFGKYFQALWD